MHNVRAQPYSTVKLSSVQALGCYRHWDVSEVFGAVLSVLSVCLSVCVGTQTHDRLIELNISQTCLKQCLFNFFQETAQKYSIVPQIKVLPQCL